MLDTYQDITTIFFPRLHTITDQHIIGPSKITTIVVGNKTPYLGIDKKIYVRVKYLTKFITQPCVYKQNSHAFERVKTWKHWSLFDIIRADWVKHLLCPDLTRIKETSILTYYPFWITLSFGYQWDKYPIRLSKPNHWEQVLSRREFVMRYEREKRSHKSTKLKEMKRENPKVFKEFTVDYEFSVDLRMSSCDNECIRTAETLEKIGQRPLGTTSITPRKRSPKHGLMVYNPCNTISSSRTIEKNRTSVKYVWKAYHF